MDLRQELPYRANYVNNGEEDEECYCNGCHGPIEEDSLRFAVESHLRSANRALIWHHFSCFFDRFRPRVHEIAHFAQLRYNDQKRVRRAIKRSLLQAFSELSDLSSDDNDSDVNNAKNPKKRKKAIDPKEEALKQQSDSLYKSIRFLETMETEDIIKLMEHNKIDVPLKTTSRYDRLADAMTFGRLVKCPKCKEGQLVFRICGYICSGYAYELNKKRKWFRCDYQTTDTPQRKPFKVTKTLQQKYDYLKKYKYHQKDRIYIPSLVRSAQEIAGSEPS